MAGGAPALPVATPQAAPAPPPSTNGSKKAITSPLPGSVFTLKCKVGDRVNEGDTVIILEAMKMETEVNSPYTGTVDSILVAEGANVQTGDELILIA